MNQEYKYDRGRIIRINKRLKFFGKIVKFEYAPPGKEKKWSPSARVTPNKYQRQQEETPAVI